MKTRSSPLRQSRVSEGGGGECSSIYGLRRQTSMPEPFFFLPCSPYCAPPHCQHTAGPDDDSAMMHAALESVNQMLATGDECILVRARGLVVASRYCLEKGLG